MSSVPGACLYEFRDSRVERLVADLDRSIKFNPAHETALLVPSIVVVANAGLRRWLPLELARARQRHGQRGVVADLQTLLPSAYFKKLGRRVLGAATQGMDAYESAALPFRIYSELGRIKDPQLDAYLGGDSSNEAGRAVRRWGMAQRLAQLYAEYMIYRPDWLSDWQRNSSPQIAGVPVSPSFVPELWRRLAAADGLHRGAFLQKLAEEIDRTGVPALVDESDSAPVHVFGFTHMPQVELAVWSAIAKHRPVFMYLPDPADVHWTGIAHLYHDRRDALQADDYEQVQLLEDDLQANVHPLLRSWSRLGQHFFMQLENLELHSLAAYQDKDQALEPESDSRLHAVQHSIRANCLEALHVDTDSADFSLRVHSAVTAMRELEVLRDALWSAFARNPTLKPSDVLILAPRMATYAPYLPAIFGPAATIGQRQLPYQVADVALASTHPFFIAVGRLLDLLSSPFGLSQFLQLLESESVQANFGLIGQHVQDIADTLKTLGVAWGLDENDAGSPTHHLQWGIDRLIAQYLIGETHYEPHQRPCWEFGEQTFVPIADSRADPSEWLGALQQIVDELRKVRDESQRDRPLVEWIDLLDTLIQKIVSVPAAVDSYDPVLRWAPLLGQMHTAAAHLPEPVPFALARVWMQQHLDGVDEQLQPLFGGMTFADLASRRGLPHAFIAVLGLNDKDFPRQASDQGLDLMRRYPRIGDRPYAVDDRYAFLEAVMSARKQLHLSYQGRSERDGSVRNAALPLQDLINAMGGTKVELPPQHPTDDKGETKVAPWFFEHPVHARAPANQPLNPAPAIQDNAEQGAYSSERGDGYAAAGVETFEQVVARGLAAPHRIIRPDDVRRYYQSPFETVARFGADALADKMPSDAETDVEPLDAEFGPIERIPQFLVRALLMGQRLEQDEPAPWLRGSGKLPPGKAGLLAWQAALQQANDAVAEMATAHADFNKPLHVLPALAIEFESPPFTVRGRLNGLLRGEQSHWLVVCAFRSNKDGKLEKMGMHFGELIPALIEWALARLTISANREVRPMLVAETSQHELSTRWNRWCDRFAQADETEREQMLGALRKRLGKLLAFCHANIQTPRFYAPKTSLSSLFSSAAETWNGGFNRNGESAYTIYSQMADADGLFGESDDDSKELVEQVQDDARALRDLLMLDEAVA